MAIGANGAEVVGVFLVAKFKENQSVIGRTIA